MGAVAQPARTPVDLSRHLVAGGAKRSAARGEAGRLRTGHDLLGQRTSLSFMAKCLQDKRLPSAFGMAARLSGFAAGV